MGGAGVNNCVFLQLFNGHFNRISRCAFTKLKKVENVVYYVIRKTNQIKYAS